MFEHDLNFIVVADDARAMGELRQDHDRVYVLPEEARTASVAAQQADADGRRLSCKRKPCDRGRPLRRRERYRSLAGPLRPVGWSAKWGYIGDDPRRWERGRGLPSLVRSRAAAAAAQEPTDGKQSLRRTRRHGHSLSTKTFNAIRSLKGISKSQQVFVSAESGGGTATMRTWRRLRPEVVEMKRTHLLLSMRGLIAAKFLLLAPFARGQTRPSGRGSLAAGMVWIPTGEFTMGTARSKLHAQ